MEPKASVGRIVHANYQGRRTPAIVLEVLDDGEIFVEIFGQVERVLMVCKYATETAESAAEPNLMTTPMGSWSWPPRV